MAELDFANFKTKLMTNFPNLGLDCSESTSTSCVVKNVCA